MTHIGRLFYAGSNLIALGSGHGVHVAVVGVVEGVVEVVGVDVGLIICC